MFSQRKIVEVAKKCQKIAALGSIGGADQGAKRYGTTRRGHIIIQTMDGQRFMIPLAYLKNNIFIELFRMSKEEFGLPRDGPITLPCSATSMEEILSSLKRRVSKDKERALFATINATTCSTSCSIQQESHQKQQLLYGF